MLYIQSTSPYIDEITYGSRERRVCFSASVSVCACICMEILDTLCTTHANNSKDI